MKPLPGWIKKKLADSPAEGEGRNNLVIQLAPRMMEHGWDEEAIFVEFKVAYDLEDDSSKDGEIRRVIRNGRRYVRNGPAARPNAGWREEAVRLARIKRDALRELPNILDRYCWRRAELDCGLNAHEQRVRFLRTMFDADEIIWSGDKHHSGKPHHARHFRPAAEWLAAEAWPFVSQSTFKPGAFSRCNEMLGTRKYMVVESDILADEEILSIFCWLHHEQGFPLRAVVFSGKRSLHGWFDRPGQSVRELAAILEGLRCDPATCRPIQPVRLPGVIRRETGRLQELLYLDAGQAR